MTMIAEISFGVETSRAATTTTSPSTMATSLDLLKRGASSGKNTTMMSEKLAKKAKKSNFRSGLSDAGDAFGLLCAALYNLFKQEDEIDRRILKDFLDNMETAPPLSDGERALLKSLTTLSRKVDEKGKRLPGTVKDPVEKFLFWPKGSNIAIGKSVAKIDVSAKELFAYLWVQNTHKQKREHFQANDDLPRAVWENLDGTRSLQFTVTKLFPKGLMNRYFESWSTWEARTLKDGRKEFIIGEELL